MDQTLTPFRIGQCTIKNRFVMTAANLGWCTDGCVTDQVVRFYEARASGGVGLIIAGAAGVDPVRKNQHRMMQICDDAYIPGLKNLTDRVHGAGAKIFVQLMHAGAYAKQTEHDGEIAVAPSEWFCPFTREKAIALTVEEIREIVRYFGQGARRAEAAGFDGVELIGSAGYLIAEFLSVATNHRKDAYGGSLENRMRFLTEIIAEIGSQVSPDFPVIVRLSGTDFVEGGNGPQEFVAIGRQLSRMVDAIDVTGGWHESAVPQITSNVPHGMYLYLAKSLKDEVDIPVIGCNRLNLTTARVAVRMGYCDFVGMLRSFIAEPELVRKYEENRQIDIRPCVACNQQCLERMFAGGGVACTVNPYVGREGSELEHLDCGKRILVIGAGISGLAYGAKAGETNQVTIWEKDWGYGGQGNLVARIPGMDDIQDYINYLFRQCFQLGVDFEWNREGRPEEIRALLASGAYDKVVIAAGASCGKPDWPIDPHALVFQAGRDDLSGALPGSHIVVIGGGYKAVQVAQYLYYQKGRQDKKSEFLKEFAPEYYDYADNIMKWSQCRISILAPEKRFGTGFGRSIRFTMLQDIKQKGIRVIKEAVVTAIERDAVRYTVDGEPQSIAADSVILCEGYRKNETFIFEDGVGDGRITTIGDAKRPGRISEAVADAFAAAIK